MSFFGVVGGGGGRCSHDVVYNSEGGGLFSFDWRVLGALGFNMTGEDSVQSGVGLGVWRLSRVGEAIQEVGRQNHPPRLRNRLLTKSVQLLLGIVVIPDPVSVYL